MRLLELVVLATGRAIFSPAFRSLRMIVELLPCKTRDDAAAHLLAVFDHGHGVVGDRAGRDVDAFGLLDDDFGGCAHAGLQTGFHLVQLEGDVVADDPAAAGRQNRQAHHFSRELAPFERFDGDGGDLPDMDA